MPWVPITTSSVLSLGNVGVVPGSNYKLFHARQPLLVKVTPVRTILLRQI
jgi:hypothetical protein